MTTTIAAMGQRRWLCGIISVIALVGCAPTPPTKQSLDLIEIGNRLVRDECGGNGVIADRPFQNRYDPNVIDTIRRINCAGMEMEIYRGHLVSDPHGLPIYLEIREANPWLPAALNAGQPAVGPQTMLGAPNEQTDDSATYFLGESGDSVTFSFHDGRIASIRWEWYID